MFMAWTRFNLRFVDSDGDSYCGTIFGIKDQEFFGGNSYDNDLCSTFGRVRDIPDNVCYVCVYEVSKVWRTSATAAYCRR